MCGIVGYIGNKEKKEILLDGLQELEYRGYDSAGIAIIENRQLKNFKAVGRLQNLRDKTKDYTSNGFGVSIGHTRWATHGKPSEENAHPHLSEDFAIVHNGIIENYLELKQSLIEQGYKFNSETDTEVIAHLIHSIHEDNLLTTVQKALKKIKGSYALAVLFKKDTGRIIVARNDSPLVIGLGKNENFAASDMPAVLQYTRNFLFLEDGDVAELTKDNVIIYDNNGQIIQREIKYIDWNPVMAEKAGYKHFMQKEIYEQPRAIIDTIRGKYSLEEGKVYFEELDKVDLKNINKIHIIACGTSWHAGLIGKFYIEKFAKIPVEVAIASEYRYGNPIIDENTLFIAISQSGETADTLAALRIAKKNKAKIITICNVIGSTMTRESDGIIHTHAGPEIGVASTKAFTTQVASLFMFAIYLSQMKNTISIDERQKLLKEIVKIPEKIEILLEEDNKIEKLARKYKNFADFLFLGRNVNYPIALEGALKLKEISYIHAEGYPAGEMKHGPIALIDKQMPVFVMATDSDVFDKVAANIEEVKARDGIVIATFDNLNNDVIDICDDVIVVPQTIQDLSIFTNVVVTQFFAYHCANLLGLDVDQPRNLAKSVTVE
jgi:glucosamine--fructose-6-phosphate aminotransferase (isomerizing)